MMDKAAIVVAAVLERACPYELADNDMGYRDLAALTLELLEDEPGTVLGWLAEE
jgi:hypothetical protein